MTIGLELHKIGTISYIDLDSGFYGIIGDDGTNYYPIHSFNSEYRVEGQRVSFVATTREDYYAILSSDILQWGIPMEVISINAIGVAPGEEALPVVQAGIPSTSWYKNTWIWVAVGALVLLSGGFGKKYARKKR